MQLLPHQIEDAAFLAVRRFAGCFSGMGSGKTLTALEAFNLSLARRLLIIAPPIALRMWEDVAEMHCTSKAQILRTGSTPILNCNILICSYAIAVARADELKQWLRADISALICDESHALKSAKAKRTKAILGRDGICGGARYAWLLTGTPMTRWNDDLTPFLWRAAPDVMREKLGALSEERFKLRYCIQQERKFAGARWPTKMVVGNRNTEELRDILYGEHAVAVRRELSEVWDAMPPLTTNTYEIKLHGSPEFLASLKELNKASVSQIAQRMQTNDPALATVRRQLGEAKVRGAAEVIADRVESGLRPILVGAWHTAVIDGLAENLRIKGLSVAVLDGRTSAPRRHDLEMVFNEGQLDVLIGQISAMGVSLNLQRGGNTIVVVERDWSPAVMDQFYARLHRMGQRKHVHVDILDGGTKLEAALARIAADKTREAKTLNDAERV